MPRKPIHFLAIYKRTFSSCTSRRKKGISKTFGSEFLHYIYDLPRNWITFRVKKRCAYLLECRVGGKITILVRCTAGIQALTVHRDTGHIQPCSHHTLPDHFQFSQLVFERPLNFGVSVQKFAGDEEVLADRTYEGGWGFRFVLQVNWIMEKRKK